MGSLVPLLELSTHTEHIFFKEAPMAVS